MLDFNAYREAVRRSYYEQEPTFQTLLDPLLGDAWRAWGTERFKDVGLRAATHWAELSRLANENPPKLRPYNPWGDRIDAVDVHPAYDELAKEAYEAGVVWPRFDETTHGEKAPWAVVFGLGYLLGQAEQGLFCPICLTAGTAWLLERFGESELKAHYLPHVASSDYESLYEGAMFLTERAGGSDVGAATLEALEENGVWKLSGDKWFASNAGRAKAMMVLARPIGASTGTKGLGLFMVPLERPDGTRNAIRINRLKDKLGTRSMPSGEVSFENALAYPVGDVTRGFLHMAEMLNLSRIYNAVGSTSAMRRVLNEAIAYTHARSAFGAVVDSYPLIREQLIGMAIEQEASLRLTFEAIRLLDVLERKTNAPRDAALLRGLTPMLKYFTARQSVDMASAAIELFGGNGYIEDWPVARFLRDAQVLTIWEGTTNILLLDFLRACAKEGAGTALVAELGARLGATVPAAIAPWRERLCREAADIEAHLDAISRVDTAVQPSVIKPWCDRAVRLYQAVLLQEAAAKGIETDCGRPLLVLAAFMHKHYVPHQWREQVPTHKLPTAYAPIVTYAPIRLAEALGLLRGHTSTPI